MATRRRSPQPATPEALLAVARRRFLHGRRLDIQTLADEVGVSRATAYRWAGGNVEQITGTVIASIATDTFERAVREAEGTGADFLRDAMVRGLRYMSSSGPYRQWLKSQDADMALRIVASKAAAPQGTMIRLWEELLTDEQTKGTVELPVDPHTMAYAIVRVSEAFLYADLIAGEEPDMDKAIAILELLIR